MQSFEPDLAKLHHPDIWGPEPPAKRFEDFFKLAVDLGPGGSLETRTHEFGETQIVPYHDDDKGVADAAGNTYSRGDAFLSAVFPPGSIGFQLKHRRPQNRLVKPSAADDFKQLLKLHDTHVGLMVGVPEREGAPGVVSLHNPQGYDKGRFGRDEPGYSMILLKPELPRYVPARERRALENNIRTMMVAFNTVSKYPKETYDGADPLGATSVTDVRENVRQMILAIGGTRAQSRAARAWFMRPENLIYCSELAHISANAGLHVPLNAKGGGALVSAACWRRFCGHVSAHNRGEATPFTEWNHNPRVKHIELAIAPSRLRAAPSYAPPSRRKREQAKLAFPPLSMSQLVGRSTNVLARAQRRSRNATGPTFADLGKQFAADLATPRGSEDPLFVPPSILQLIATGRHRGGLLRLRYAGHGLHISLVRPKKR